MRDALGLETLPPVRAVVGRLARIEYLAAARTGSSGLILATTSASIKQFTGEARKLIEQLPEPHAPR